MFFSFWLGPVSEDLSTQLKECLKMGEDAKLECDLLKINDIALWSHWILETCVWWGASLCPLATIQTSVKFCKLWRAIFSFTFKCITFKLGKFHNLKALIPENKMWRGLFHTSTVAYLHVMTLRLASKQALQGTLAARGEKEGELLTTSTSGILISALKKSMRNADWRRRH